MKNYYFFEHNSFIVQINEFFYFFISYQVCLICLHVPTSLMLCCEYFSSAHSASPLYFLIRAFGDYFLLSSCSFNCFFYFIFHFRQQASIDERKSVRSGYVLFLFYDFTGFIFAFCVRYLLITNLKWSHIVQKLLKDNSKKIAPIYDVKSLVWLFYVKANLLDVWATFPELND